MIAWTSADEIFRSTPLTISGPSSSETCRSFNSSVAKACDSSGLTNKRFCSSVRDSHVTQAPPDHSGPPEPPAQPERGPDRGIARGGGEAPTGALVARERLEQVVRRADRLVGAGVLPLPAVPPQHEVAGARGELLAPEELLGAPGDRQLADRMLPGVEHRLRVRLRLVDGRH